MTANATPAAWYQDPTGQGEARYWNGSVWTESVMRGGVAVDVPIDPNEAVVPPVPGTEVVVSVAPTASAPLPVQQGRGFGGFFAGVIAVAVVVLVVVVLVALTGGDSSDAPAPGDDAPPATEAPAPDASTGG